MKSWYPPGAITTINEFVELLKTIKPGARLKLWSTGTYNEEKCPLKAVHLTSETTIQGAWDEDATAAPAYWENSPDSGWVDLARRVIIDTETPMYIFTNYWFAYGHKIQQDSKRKTREEV